MIDRTTELKAVTCAFIAENTLPYSLSPNLIRYAKRMSKDIKALEKVSMSRVNCMYTSTHGLAKSMQEELAKQLNGSYLSLNVDEATNNAGNKILNILARYHDTNINQIVTNHLGSRVVNLATAVNIFNTIQEVLDKFSITWPQVISCLMDNCATMRGQKSGVETLMRRANPSLLDVHGDTVHIVANAAKQFCKPFNRYLEIFANNVFIDVQQQPKQKQLFAEIHDLLHMEGSSGLIRPISSRFLQMRVVADRLHALIETLQFYYFSHLDEAEKKIYRYMFFTLIVNCSMYMKYMYPQFVLHNVNIDINVLF